MRSERPTDTIKILPLFGLLLLCGLDVEPTSVTAEPAAVVSEPAEPCVRVDDCMVVAALEAEAAVR